MWSYYSYWNPWVCGWRRHWWFPPFAWSGAFIPKEEEIAMLEEQAHILERELENIKNRLEELKK